MKIVRAVLILAVATTALSAQGRGRGRGGDDSPPPGKVRVTYSDRDRDSDSRVIATWYKEHPTEHPGRGRGRGRGHELPPGWEKKVVRSQAIPVEYREYVEPVPVVLVRTLPPVRPGWEFVLISNRVVLINRPTWMVIDVVITL